MAEVSVEGGRGRVGRDEFCFTCEPVLVFGKSKLKCDESSYY